MNRPARQNSRVDIAREQITGAVLAGGEGRRLGGVDKGWFELAGEPLIERTIARLAPQCGELIISANRSLPQYRALGYLVYGDDDGDVFRGPLAGTAVVLRAAATPYVLTVPVDTPLLPLDLAARLAAAMRPETQIAIAARGEQRHHLHALVRRDVLDDLLAALCADTRAMRDWHAGLDCVVVEWLDSGLFVNINDAADAVALARRL